MSPEQVQLGNLQCLQEIDVPQAAGDILVQPIFHEYQDSHFTNGWGLQSVGQVLIGQVEALVGSGDSPVPSLRTI